MRANVRQCALCLTMAHIGAVGAPMRRTATGGYGGVLRGALFGVFGANMLVLANISFFPIPIIFFWHWRTSGNKHLLFFAVFGLKY